MVATTAVAAPTVMLTAALEGTGSGAMAVPMRRPRPDTGAAGTVADIGAAVGTGAAAVAGTVEDTPLVPALRATGRKRTTKSATPLPGFGDLAGFTERPLRALPKWLLQHFPNLVL